MVMPKIITKNAHAIASEILDKFNARADELASRYQDSAKRDPSSAPYLEARLKTITCAREILNSVIADVTGIK